MACKVGEHPGRERLYLRLWWRGRETWETTGLAKTKANREKLQRIADAVSAEIRARSFGPERYLYWFPEGRRAAEFRPPEPPPEPPKSPTLNHYYDTWISRYERPDVRPSRIRDYRLHLGHYVLPQIGDIRLDQLKARHLRDLRATLSRQGLS